MASEENPWWTQDAQNLRQNVVAKIDEAIRKSGTPTTKNSIEMESHLFQKAKTKEEYMILVAKLVLHIREFRTNEICGLKWFDYKYFNSMSNESDTGNTQEGEIQNDQSRLSVQSESTPCIQTESTPSTSSNQRSENTQDQDQVVQQPSQSPTELAPSPEQPPRKKKRTSNTNVNGNDSIDRVLKETFEIHEKASSSMNDSCTAFVNYIAHELRKYDPHTLSCVKNAMNNIIHEADMGKYQMYRPGYNTQQSQKLPGCSASSTSTLPP